MSLLFHQHRMWTHHDVAGYSLMSPEECELIASQIPENAGPEFRVLEIGTYNGASAAHVLSKRPRISWLGIDIFRAEPAFATMCFLANRAKHKNLNCFIGSARQWLAWQGPAARADLVIVDGGHSEAECRDDLDVASQVSTTIICHDYGVRCFPGIVKAVDEFPGWRIVERERSAVLLQPEAMP